jgi:L-2-aminoadipate reductase
VECPDVSQNVADCADDIVPLQDIRSHLKSRNLFRFAAFRASGSGDTTECDETTDLQLDVSITSNGGMRITAIYNPSLFSNARIATTLTQLFQIIQDASTDPSQPVGAIDLLTPTQRKLLPDPTRDLGWSDFRGAIHDIFSRNAEAHPERPCVVETRAGGTPERSFTYKQINEASNILGHLLVKSGIQRGDVVMIYSHRGVDLVVAVMGILKAGATFSVLDPAYPPDRQNIYLEVAKPSALVVIAKATQEAGEISETVRAFISANLKLRVEVPSLALRGDGSLIGGDVAGRDVLASVEHLGASSPGVVVGPDSTPTLSFTSGSEGKPKGVRGRHFSLAYYFDWMAKTFKLSENDRFTMLSGIAHDPIQRDVFTPLFLGAQLLVPSRDDIQNERLAEWMKEHGATVTHLTPAMGQILVGGASAVFDKLHHAFFVGDILIKRDCRALQELAPNVCIVNMYGTTETQRAVSYFEIPSYASDKNYLAGMKDVIPAGKGMFNVQLLVVNRYDPTKLCAVGELGEIYVRAGGLAEGYLGTPELTEKKFVKNWFVDPGQWVKEYEAKKASSASNDPWQEFYFGPRDRLYRSGDLGRYTPTGDVECSGRADDQVKIRGFRIELGEIDTHLSRHPLVLQNVTLVRRDMNEEHTLVSYVVPDMAAWKSFLQTEGLEDQHDSGSLASRFQRFRLLQREVQAYLKTKLAAYAVPSVILPMEMLPLNPNGKVDKPKLPFPDVSMVGAHRRQSSIAEDLSDFEKNLAQIWSRVVPGLIPRTIRPDDSFTDLGGTSMHAQQLPFNIRREWKGADITMGEVIRNPKLRDMAASIERVLAGGANDVRPPSEVAYGEDALTLPLPQRFLPATEYKSALPVVFLTGVTGFLGAYILRDLFKRIPNFRVAVLVRAKTKEAALDRIKTTCEAYGIWSDSWPSRLLCIPGSLDKSRFGMTDEDWEMLVEDTDIVIHNGAEVHWGKTYETLKPTNVLGTLEAIKLCEQAKPRSFVFVSSTSVLDTEHYVRVSENRTKSGLNGISEADDLQGSRQGLGTGYGQSKWVAEYIVREAGNRGLCGGIVRPGYVLGDSSFGGEFTYSGVISY